jgi:hypothetical protein
VLPEGLSGMKNPSDTIGNRTRELKALNVVREPTAPPHSIQTTELVCYA